MLFQVHAGNYHFTVFIVEFRGNGLTALTCCIGYVPARNKRVFDLLFYSVEIILDIMIHADRMVAALYGIPGLMVIPRGPDLGAQVILKRKWEKKHWQKYYDRGGKTL